MGTLAKNPLNQNWLRGRSRFLGRRHSKDSRGRFARRRAAAADTGRVDKLDWGPPNGGMANESGAPPAAPASLGHRVRIAARAMACPFAQALRPPPLWAVAIVCVVTGAHTGLRWWQTAAHLHLDAMIYYGAAQLAAAGRIGAIFDPYALTEFLNGLFLAGSGQVRLFLAPWLYPPIYLLAVVPFAPLPFGWFYGIFQLITAGMAALALAWRKGPLGTPGVVALLLAPASVINVISGQNALLTLALLVGGFRLLASRPLVAGVLFGALAYKPQLLLLVPVALIAARSWRALAATAASAALLALLSAALFGVGAWTAWVGELLHPPGNFSADWFQDSVMRGHGVYVCALRLGAPPALAAAVQAASAAVAVWLVYRVYRTPADWDLRLAVLLCGIALATPHLAPYDLVLVACAVTLLFARSFPSGFMPGEAILLGFAWSIPIVRPADALIGALAPLVIASVAGYALAKISLSRAGDVSQNHALAASPEGGAIPSR